MKTITVLFSTMLLSLTAVAHPGGPGVSVAKAAELSAHRVDRMVALGKLDAAFLKKIEKIEASPVQNQAPVFYKVRVSQTAAGGAAPIQVDMTFDEDGKPLASQNVAGGSAGPDYAWPGVDSITLIENSMHYVLDNTANAQIAPYDKGFTQVTLTKGTYKGQQVARGQISSSLAAQKLNVYLGFDGTVLGTEFVP